MFRAKRLFEKQGFIVIPFKVDYKIKNNKVLTILDLFPSTDNLKTTETAVREIIGRLFYLVNS